MRILRWSTLTLIWLAILAPVVAGADIPRMINYQAVITDDQGDPINQNGVSFEFSIHDAAAFGTQRWQEGPIVKDVVEGLLSHPLGSVLALPDSLFANYAELWLEMSVDGEALPRVQLLASSYAFRVSTVDSARGGTIAGEVSVEGSSLGDQFSVINSGDGGAGYLQIANPASTGTALVATTNSFFGTAAEVRNTGGGIIATMSGAFIDIQDVNQTTKVVLNAVGPPNMGGRISLRDRNGDERVELNGDMFGGGRCRLNHADGTAGVELDGALGQAQVYDALSDGRVQLATGGTSGGFIAVDAPNGTSTVDIRGSETGTDGAEIRLRQAGGIDGIVLDAEQSGGPVGGGGSRIDLLNSAGVVTVSLDSDVSGDGRVITEVLEITGGADLSEQFEISPGALADIEPGMVLSIDPDCMGQLRVSTEAYDPTVAGIVSGAGGVKTGMLMGQSGSVAHGQHAVALTGRVWCKADASNGSIRPGDLLTTSETPGHAMKVDEVMRSHGCIIGKAMSSLDHSTGLVLVLVGLQ